MCILSDVDHTITISTKSDDFIARFEKIVLAAIYTRHNYIKRECLYKTIQCRGDIQIVNYTVRNTNIIDYHNSQKNIHK